MQCHGIASSSTFFFRIYKLRVTSYELRLMEYMENNVYSKIVFIFFFSLFMGSWIGESVIPWFSFLDHVVVLLALRLWLYNYFVIEFLSLSLSLFFCPQYYILYRSMRSMFFSLLQTMNQQNCFVFDLKYGFVRKFVFYFFLFFLSSYVPTWPYGVWKCYSCEMWIILLKPF